MKGFTDLLALIALILILATLTWPRCGPATATYLTWDWTGPHCSPVLLPDTR